MKKISTFAIGLLGITSIEGAHGMFRFGPFKKASTKQEAAQTQPVPQGNQMTRNERFEKDPEIIRLEEDVERLTTKVHEKEGENEFLIQQLQQKADENEALIQQFQQKETENADLKQQLQNETQLLKTERDVVAALREYKNAYLSLQKENNSLASQQKSAENARIQSDKLNENLQAKVTELTEKERELKERYNELEKEKQLAEIEKRNAEAELKKHRAFTPCRTQIIELITAAYQSQQRRFSVSSDGKILETIGLDGRGVPITKDVTDSLATVIAGATRYTKDAHEYDKLTIQRYFSLMEEMGKTPRFSRTRNGRINDAYRPQIDVFAIDVFRDMYQTMKSGFDLGYESILDNIEMIHGVRDKNIANAILDKSWLTTEKIVKTPKDADHLARIFTTHEIQDYGGEYYFYKSGKFVHGKDIGIEGDDGESWLNAATIVGKIKEALYPNKVQQQPAATE